MIDAFRIPGKPGVVRLHKPSTNSTGAVLDYSKMQATDLQYLSRDHVFFTHALLDRKARIQHDLLAEIAENAPEGADLGLFYVDCGVPIFPCLGPDWPAPYRWCSTVFGCPIVSFDFVATCLMSVRGVDAAKDWACFSGMDLISIPDPLHLAEGRRYANSDKIRLAVFTVTTTKARFGFVPNDTFERHTVLYEKPATDMDRSVIAATLALVKGKIDASVAAEIVPESANTATDGAADSAVPSDPDSRETS